MMEVCDAAVLLQGRLLSLLPQKTRDALLLRQQQENFVKAGIVIFECPSCSKPAAVDEAPHRASVYSPQCVRTATEAMTLLLWMRL